MVNNFPIFLNNTMTASNTKEACCRQLLCVSYHFCLTSWFHFLPDLWCALRGLIDFRQLSSIFSNSWCRQRLTIFPSTDHFQIKHVFIVVFEESVFQGPPQKKSIFNSIFVEFSSTTLYQDFLFSAINRCPKESILNRFSILAWKILKD